MSQIGSPQSYKRNAFLSIYIAALFAKCKYGVEMDILYVRCDFNHLNKACIKTKVSLLQMILEYYISLLTSKFTKLYQHKIGIMGKSNYQ